MASTISAGITTTTALSYSADTSGVLQLQTNGGTTALTLDTSQNATFAGKVASASSLQLATNGTTTAVTIDTNQNFGLGVTPDSIGSNWKALELANGIYLASYTGSTNADMYLGCNNYWNGTAYIGKVSGYNATQYEQYQGQHRWWNTNGSNVTGGSSFTFTQAMTLDASGNLIIASGVLQTTAGNVRVNTDSSTGTLTVFGTVTPRFDNNSSVGTSSYRWSAIYAANGTIQTSDGKEKNTIQNSALGLEFVNALRPVSYKWNVGSNVVTTDEEGNQVVTPRAGIRTHFGFIAQEVKEALGEQDFGGYVQEENGRLGLRYDQFIAPLVKAIQELAAQVTTLQTQVTALKG